MSRHRNAALALHGLHPDDQHWVLGQLDAGDRDTLQTYLGELKDLGIPAGAGLAPPAPPRPAAPSLRTAAPAQIAALLADEPAWLAGHLLELADWPWKNDYLAGLPLAQRKLLAHVALPALAERTAQSLLAQFEAKLARNGAGRVAHATVPASLSKRRAMLLSMRHTVRRWF